MAATLYYLLYSVLYTANFVSAAYLYRHNAELGSAQLLYGRSIIATLCIVIWLRSDLKRITYTDVIGQHDFALAFRSIQSAFSNIVKTVSTKYISLLMISIISNMGPFLTVLMAWAWLGETMRAFEFVIMFLQTCCIAYMLLGSLKRGEGIVSGSATMQVIMYGL